MTKYRDRLDIIADVLKVVSDGARKTRIMYMANLSYTLLTRYLTDVIDLGLVRKDEKKIYKLTDKGSNFLRKFKSYRKRQVKIEKKLSEIKDEEALLINRFLTNEDKYQLEEEHSARWMMCLA